MSTRIDEQTVTAELARAVLVELNAHERAEAAPLVHELVADWAREANSASDPQSVLAIQRADLDEALRDKHGSDRLTVLRVATLERAIRRLSVKSFALGTAVVDKRTTPDTARAEGQALMAETDALLPRLQAIGDADAAKRLRRDLNEVRMEALFAVERKAMSLRLNRYQQEHGPPR